MLQRPAFRPDVQPVFLPPNRVFLVGEFEQFVIQGQSSLLVAELIDGHRSVDEIVAMLSQRISTMQVYYVLALLEQQGYIVEAGAMPPAQAAYWSAQGVDPRCAQERLEQVSVRIATVGGVSGDALAEQLLAYGLRLTAEAEDLLVVLTDDYLHDQLAELNQAALLRQTPWMLIRPNGVEPWIGPLFRPGLTGCWDCLRQRLRANHDVAVYLQSLAGQRPFQALAAHPASVRLALDLAAIEILRWAATGTNTVEGNVLSMHCGSMQTEQHILVRRPQCPQCGQATDPSDLRLPPIAFASRPKVQMLDTSHRTTTPEAMLLANQHHISPITGIVRELKRVGPPGDSLRHVYVSGRNMALPLDSEAVAGKAPRSHSGGKGTTDIQARASALGEAIERYSGTRRGEERRLTATLHELGDRAIDPRLCMNYSDAQYRERESWNRTRAHHRTVPLPFDPDARIDWTPLWSLTRGEPRYLPTSFCYYAGLQPGAMFYCAADSNGCASGSSLEEAVLHGLLELIERDSTALWWYNQLQKPALDLESFGDPYINLLVDDYRRLKREIWALDLTSDLGIPAFVAVSCRTDDPGAQIIFAPSAHFDPRIAVLRALTELNQLLYAVRDGPGDGPENEDFRTWWNHTRLGDQPYLSPDPNAAARRRLDFPHHASGDLREDLLLCQSIIESQNMEVLVLDQTRADIGLPVVRVVVPGLRHFWPRFAPGRLYDVPVKQGWLATPLREDQLNPVPIFI